MKKQFTPGPWNIVEADDDVASIIVAPNSTDQGDIVCEPPRLQASRVRWNPNARLIAAAPDMLEALEKIAKLYLRDRSCSLEAQGYTQQQCEQFGLDDYAAQIAREAIQKATGGNP